MNESSLSALFDKQREFFKKGSTGEINFRISHLKKLRQAIDEGEVEILKALGKDLGKSNLEGYVSEVGLVIAEIDYMIKNLPRFSKPQKVKTPLMYFGAKSYIYTEPLGVVLIIGPWNYPFQLLMAPLLGAIAAGNCAILKPSELAPHTSAILHELIGSNFPPEYISVIEGGIETSTVLLEQNFDHIFFTGGAGVGRIVMQGAARHLTPVTLELGGKSPCIVDKEVNLQYAARRISWGKFLNAGQTCVAPDYLLVHREIKEQLLEKIKQVINGFYGQDTFNSSDYGRIINERHFNRLTAMLEDGDILYGGRSNRQARYIEPTIMENISPDSPLLHDEIFGPILPVLEYQSLDEVIQILKTKPKPLALYFFSNDKSKQEYVIQNSSSGGVCINDTLSHITTRDLPFGGVGDSGMGAYHGKTSFDIFSHRKSVLKHTLRYDTPVKYPPYKVSLQKMKKLLKLL
ncbi:MAG: aldehyde dehydrogenase [Syntrophomonas sp.]